jgi:CHAD domain-containing protein
MKRVAKIRKRAGKVRDLDVLTSNLASVQVDGENECEVTLLEHLGSERHRQASKLHRLVKNEKQELKMRLRKAANNLAAILQKNGPEPASLAAAHALQLSSDLATPQRLHRGNLHSFRLKVKELRYVLQLADAERREFLNDLGDVKDAIGDWHDWQELIGRANEILDHGSSCRLLHKLKQISDARYEKAVQLAARLRRNYLRVAPPSVKKPQPIRLSPAAISATAALSESVRRAA